MKQTRNQTLLVVAALAIGCSATQGSETDPRVASGDAAARAVAGLPLVRGYYVRQDTRCADASNASLTTFTGVGLNAAQAFCSLEALEKRGEGSYVATDKCTHIRGEEESADVEITVHDRTSYTRAVVGEDSTWSARHCPQESLPEPWRSNDLSRLLR